MSAMDDFSKTQTALFALGPQAVEVLKGALKGDGSVTSDQIEAARDTLDRMGIRAKESGS